MDEERVVDGRIKTIVLPTPERVAKGDLEIEETSRGGVNIRSKRTLNDILAYYERNGHITPRQYRAALRFHTLWYYGAFKSGYVLMKYAERQAPAGETDWAAEAQNAYHMARKAIRGTREKEIALRVCCHGERAGRHGQLERLRSALDDLVLHFKIREGRNTDQEEKR